jgi:hypothetical protein
MQRHGGGGGGDDGDGGDGGVWHVGLDAAVAATAVLRGGPIQSVSTLTLPPHAAGGLATRQQLSGTAAAPGAGGAGTGSGSPRPEFYAAPAGNSGSTAVDTVADPADPAAASARAFARREAATVTPVGRFLVDDRADFLGDAARHQHGITVYRERFPFERNLIALSQQYDVVRRVATNQDTVVYEARCRASGQRLAIKVKDDADMAAVDREVKLMAAVQGHRLFPQFVAWHAFPETGTCAIVMDFFDFGDVKDVFEAPEDARRYLFSLFTALAFLHRRNIIYRDVKPTNLLWSARERRAKLIDFDVSTFACGTRAQRKQVGTDGYMAPELALVKYCRVERVRLQPHQHTASVRWTSWTQLTHSCSSLSFSLSLPLPSLRRSHARCRLAATPSLLTSSVPASYSARFSSAARRSPSAMTTTAAQRAAASASAPSTSLPRKTYVCPASAPAWRPALPNTRSPAFCFLFRFSSTSPALPSVRVGPASSARSLRRAAEPGPGAAPHSR